MRYHPVFFIREWKITRTAPFPFEILASGHENLPLFQRFMEGSAILSISSFDLFFFACYFIRTTQRNNNVFWYVYGGRLRYYDGSEDNPTASSLRWRNPFSHSHTTLLRTPLLYCGFISNILCIRGTNPHNALGRFEISPREPWCRPLCLAYN